MDRPEVVSSAEWLAARRGLLEREKEFTRARDALSADRRRLPMVQVEKDYRFSGPDGDLRLADLFDGCGQLIVQHFMLAPGQDELCGSCVAMTEAASDGIRRHLRARDTAFAAVSRAPFSAIERTRKARGWTFPWFSSHGSDFNYDFHVSFDPAVGPASYNFRDSDELAATGLGWLVDYVGEEPGISCFLRDSNETFHTYSTFGRGLETMMTGLQLLDLTALGRQEEWEEPKGRAPVAYSIGSLYPA